MLFPFYSTGAEGALFYDSGFEYFLDSESTFAQPCYYEPLNYDTIPDIYVKLPFDSFLKLESEFSDNFPALTLLDAFLCVSIYF